MNISEDSLSDVFTGLLAAIDERNRQRFEAAAANPTIQLAVEKVRAGDVKGFHYALIYPMSNLIEGLLASELPGNRKAQFLFTHGNMVTMHLRNLFEKYEGSACCMDKAGTVVRKLARFLTTGEEISFKTDGPYRFNLPTTILRTHKDILMFFDALETMSYGTPGPYLKALEAIAESSRNPQYPQLDTEN